MYFSSDSSSDRDEDTLRQYRVRINFTINIEDSTFNERFRISKQSVQFIVQEIGGNLRRATRRSMALEPL